MAPFDFVASSIDACARVGRVGVTIAVRPASWPAVGLVLHVLQYLLEGQLVGFLRPQSASPVPIGLASSKPGMSWQPAAAVPADRAAADVAAVSFRSRGRIELRPELDLVSLDLAARRLGNSRFR